MNVNYNKFLEFNLKFGFMLLILDFFRFFFRKE